MTIPGLPSRLRESLHRLSLLSLVLLLPLVFWTPFNDCFPLPKMLALALFGGLALVLGPWRIHPAFAWVLPWGAWIIGMALLGPGVTTIWRSVPDALVLVIPVFAALSASGIGAGFLRQVSTGLVAVAALIGGYGLSQTFGLDMGSWLSPFHKGVASTIGNPDLLGGMLVLPFALALSCWLESRSFYRSLTLAFIGAAIIATEARAAWVAAAVVMLVLSARQNRKALGVVAVSGLVFVSGWLYVHPAALGTLASGSAMEERLWTWKVSASLIRNHPLAGWGTGSFRTVFLREQAEKLQSGGAFHYTEFAHFEPVHLWAETGAVGLGLFLWGLASFFRGWRKGRRMLSEGEWRGIGAGWAGLLVDGALSFPMHVPPTATPAWVVGGAAIYQGETSGRCSWRVRLVAGFES